MVQISHKHKKNTYYINVSGEIDASSSIYLDEALSEALAEGHKKILVDCSNLSYISSAGLGVFMSYLSAIEEQKIHFILYGLSDKVMNVFQILGLDQLLNIAVSKEKAEALINEA